MDNVKVIDKIIKFKGDFDEACDIFEELGFNARQAAIAVVDIRKIAKLCPELDERIWLLCAIRNALADNKKDELS